MATTITSDTITVGNSVIRSTDTFDSSEGVIEEIVTNSNGTAIKYSNGLLINFVEVSETVSSSLHPIGFATFAVPFISEPFGYQYMQTVQHGDANYGKSVIWRYGSTNNSRFDYKVSPDDGIGGAASGVKFAVTVHGYWK